MTPPGAHGRAVRRARPLLGTLVEVGTVGAPLQAHDAAFATVIDVQAQLSRFNPASDVAWFNAARAGERRVVGAHTKAVLSAARLLGDESGDAFDVTLGTGPDGWRLDGNELVKLAHEVAFDLGGIGKGYAVDRAVDALVAAGSGAGWVNAGGDLRAFGDIDMPVNVRDELGGGVRPFAHMRDGAVATSRFGPGARSTLRASHAVDAHVTVAAPLCLWADALTKLVAITGDTAHPLLARHSAQAWQH